MSSNRGGLGQRVRPGVARPMAGSAVTRRIGRSHDARDLGETLRHRIAGHLDWGMGVRPLAAARL